MKKAILLDAGGVLLNEEEYELITSELLIQIIRTIKTDYNEEIYWSDLNESIQCFSPHNRQYILWKYCLYDISLYEKLWSSFQKLWNSKKHNLKLMKGIEKELYKLSQFYKLIVAGQYGKDLIQLIKKNNLMHLFVNQLSQDDFSITKPDPRYYEQIIKVSGFIGNECIMIGDRIDKDIIPAKQNNIGTVFIKSGVYKIQKPRTPDEIPDLILDTIIGMADKIIDKWNEE